MVIRFNEAVKVFDKVEKLDIALDELVLLTFYLTNKPMNRLTFYKRVFSVYNILRGYGLKVAKPSYKLVNQLLNGLVFAEYIKASRFFLLPKYELTEKGKEVACEIAKRIIIIL